MTAVSTLSAFATSIADGTVEVVDLTTPLSPSTPILTLPAPFANTQGLSTTPVSNFDDAGPGWAWNDLHLGEHVGTHLDAPTHWATGRAGRSVAEIQLSRLVGPAFVIDRTNEAAADADYLLEPADFEAFEAEHGQLPPGAWLLFRTGWAARGDDAASFINADDTGPHSPGVSVAGAEWLAAHPNLSGFGVEQVGIDAGQAGGFDPVFPVHHHLLGADKYGVTSLRGLDRLPVAGATVVVAPLPIVGGTGAPARVLAFVERD
ncbi:cyclase [Pseudoclavibacter endophyticus]|uniref:Cyclase family protein n=1 Tax=Pseudoclavibacter endophyticus TaxID=1778590 RepID=A0A6H9WSA8_9MICO|nr:cyclase family protein [Pseudoclavibacter endophyticus]KAB1649595.1 cyclase family protein [Pseudoclavibacter endophyticus]GGA61378.1 cyclase [Pseudoclavibacter endophyticus]